MPRITLITGGMKSGKSAQALKIADNYRSKLFIATAEPFDEELRIRIERHRKERDSTYTTVEEPLHIGSVLKEAKRGFRADAVVIDCLTLWLGNIFHRERERLDALMEDFLTALKGCPCHTIVVTTELGMGVVPVSEKTRRFVDVSGRINRTVAELSDEVIFMISGIPLFVKGHNREGT